MKHKRLTLLFILTTIGISIYGLLSPSYYLSYIIDLSDTSAYVRSSVAGLLFIYAFFTPTRINPIRSLMILFGVFSLGAGVTALFSPLMFNYFSYYIPLGDVLLALEAGVLSMLAALQLPARKVHLNIPVAQYVYYLKHAAAYLPKKLVSQTKTA